MLLVRVKPPSNRFHVVDHATVDGTDVLLWKQDAVVRRVPGSEVQELRSYSGSPEWREHTQKSRPRNGERWGQEEEEKLRKLFFDGFNIGQLADSLQRTEGAIESRLRRIGLIDPYITQSEAVYGSSEVSVQEGPWQASSWKSNLEKMQPWRYLKLVTLAKVGYYASPALAKAKQLKFQTTKKMGR